MTTIRKSLAAALAVSLVAFSASSANAISRDVKMACAAHYYSHCSQHPVGSSGDRQCMQAVGAGLSNRCIKALVAAGEVSGSVVERKVAAADCSV